MLQMPKEGKQMIHILLIISGVIFGIASSAATIIMIRGGFKITDYIKRKRDK